MQINIHMKESEFVVQKKISHKENFRPKWLHS